MGIFDTAKQGVERELEGVREFDIPWKRRLWLYRHGFISSRDALYDLSDESVGHYLSDLQQLRTANINERHAVLIQNKLTYHLVFGDVYPEHVPDIYGMVAADRGMLEMPNLPFESLDDLLDHLESNRLIVKPTVSALGRDVHVLDHDGDQPTFDGESMSRSRFERKLDGIPESILVEFVEQAPYADEIFPGSSNTVRCLTMVDPETDEPFIAAAVHRFGSETSQHVDNFSSGGVVAPVDVETGTLGEAVTSPKGGSSFSRISAHPDTETPIEGESIPGWSEVREGLLEIAGGYGDLLPYVGWDVVVTDHDGSFTLIEGNSSPDLDLLQTHQPLLVDERVRRFYEEHGVL